ncbi:BAI1-associated protein 3 [Araneus ventricosus]|uniref:BAI1-associated protein 3 n=1 Tax=Araneus ventricosus TaxID=182803 RepID=A0A4Y2AH18_ARAVE|nr:BAI1-associated protein 3 [Araneus ventricosus]
MRDGVVREWQIFKDSRTNARDKDGQERKSVANEGLVQRVDQVVQEKNGRVFHIFRELKTGLEDSASPPMKSFKTDHDDETSVFDAAKRLNEVSNLKGLGRYFKEVAQSARTSNGENVDDFLGSVNFPVEIVGSNGMDRWFTLSGRSNRSTVQGQVHLKLQLGTREDRGVATGNDNEREVAEHEQLIWIFVNHELKMFQGKPYEWAGDLPQQALTILHQHAIQGDITELQQALCQWKAYFRKHQEVVLDYALMFQQLEEIEQAWAKNEEALSLNAEDDMKNSYNEFITHCFDMLRQHRKYFPSHNTLARHKLKFMLK